MILDGENVKTIMMMDDDIRWRECKDYYDDGR